MAWLQNLAGKAEDLLNKIDQNAATVLNDSRNKNEDKSQEDDNSIQIEMPKLEDINSDPSDNSQSSDEDISPNPTIILGDDHGIATEANLFDLQNSLISDEKLIEQITKLESENQSLSLQLLNLKHLHSALQNEYLTTRTKLDNANDLVTVKQTEMDQYRTRAQKILQEKLKSLPVPKDDSDTQTEYQVLIQHIEELKTNIEFQKQLNNDLNIKLRNLSEEFENLQLEYKKLQLNDQILINELQDSLKTEQVIRKNIEEEYKVKRNELKECAMKNNCYLNTIKEKDGEIRQLKLVFKQKMDSDNNNELENKYHSLIQTLMNKQTAMENMTTEKNALRLQLERLEDEYNKVVNQLQMQNSIARQSNVVEMESKIKGNRSDIPLLMQISPFDQGVTRRVKTAYSSLDALSIRTGVFLRRYPIARVFVFCYMVLLHVWVLIILCTDVPTTL